jgi:hypothetical protein
VQVYVLSAEVIAQDVLAPFFVELESLPSWKVESTALPGERFNFTQAFVERISELLHREKIIVAGDQSEFPIGNPVKVSQGTYEFWFSWSILDGDVEPDVVEALQNNEVDGQLYIAGVKASDEACRRIKDEVRRMRRSLDIEDEILPLEESWQGFFKIILTVHKEH